MKRRITQSQKFIKEIGDLIEEGKLFKEDFETFKREIAENPNYFPVIPGTGGIRKARLKSSSKGKRGGFRVCYLDDEKKEEIFFLFIYAKNDQEDLTADEKKTLKKYAEAIKKA